MDERQSDHRLTSFEEQLAALTPSADLNRDELMFAAGRASVSTRPWRLATAASLLTAVALAGVLTWNTRAVPAEPSLPHKPIATASSPAREAAHEVPTVAAYNGPSYLAVRNRVLAEGVDSLPRAHDGSEAVAPTKTPDRDSLLRDLLSDGYDL